MSSGININLILQHFDVIETFEHFRYLDNSIETDWISSNKRRKLYEEILRDALDEADLSSKASSVYQFSSNHYNSSEDLSKHLNSDNENLKSSLNQPDSCQNSSDASSIVQELATQSSSGIVTGKSVAKKIKLPFGYWNDKERCRAEAIKYTSRSLFIRNSVSAYNSAYKHNWLNDICSHMVGPIHPSGKFNLFVPLILIYPKSLNNIRRILE